MILADLDNWEHKSFPTALQKAVQFIRNTELTGLEPGKYEIDGDNMFVMIQEFDTVAKTERKAECHAKYIDLQYLIEGEEMIYVARPSSRNVMIENELESSDYALFDEVHDESEIRLIPGMLAIFFPSDIHRPGCHIGYPGKVKKAVIKINVDMVKSAD